MAVFPPSPTILPTGFDVESSGNISYDTEYFYVKYQGWRRFPMTPATGIPYNFPSPLNEGDILTDNEYFYIVTNKQWHRFPCNVIKRTLPIGDTYHVINIKNTKVLPFPRNTDTYGTWGSIAFNAEYFCIWGQKKWHKIPIVPMPTII